MIVYDIFFVFKEIWNVVELVLDFDDDCVSSFVYGEYGEGGEEEW